MPSVRVALVARFILVQERSERCQQVAEPKLARVSQFDPQTADSLWE